MSTGIDPIDSAPLIIRTYNDDSADNTFLLTRYDYPVSSNYVLRTSANGSLAPSDALTQTTMAMSSMTISNHFGSTMVYDTFSSGSLFLPAGVFDIIIKTTMTASSVTASTIFLNVLNICTMNASTFSPNGVTVAYTTLGSTVQTTSMTYSTLIGDSFFVGAGFVSTLFGSSIHTNSASMTTTASDTSRISTLIMDSTTVGFLSFSSLQGSTLVLSTLSGSSIYTNPLTVSTLDGRLLVTSTITCASTLSVSTLHASRLSFSTTTGSSVTMSTVTAPLLFSNSLFFSTAQGSTMNVSSVTVSSLYATLLVGSTIQANTLVFSTLSVSSVNTSALTYSIAQGSTMLVSTIGVSTLVAGALSASTLSGSSMTAHTTLFSTLTGSTLSWNRVVLSTLQGSNAMVSSVTASTLVSGAAVAAGIQGSTVIVSTASSSSLNTNLFVGSTMLSDSLFFSTLTVSTLFGDSAVYSTLQGSTATLSSMTVSTLSVSTTLVSTLNGIHVVGGTLTTSSILGDGIIFSMLHGSTLLLSTLTSCSINAQTIRVSTLQGSMIGVSTLTGSTIVSSQLSYSTLIGSTIVTDDITAMSTFTGSGSLFVSSFAFSTQQTSASFLSTLIVTSTLTVSTLHRINPTSFTASTLTLNGSLQANTATGLLVCSSLTVNEMNLSRSLVNQPVYGNTVKTDSIAASGRSLVRTSDIRATMDNIPNQQQTYTFGAAIPNRWVAASNTANNALSYSNDGFNWVGVGSTILGGGRIAIWNGSMWVAVGDSAAISPARSGITTNTWTHNSVTWTATASSTLSGWSNYFAFDGVVGSDSNAWAAATNNYNSTGTYVGTVTTTVNGIPSGVSFPSPSSGTSVAGDWLQLQSSTPLTISSYTWGCANVAHQAKSFCLVGSNDGTTWHFIQYVIYPSSPCTTGYVPISTPLFAYYTGTQMVTGNVSVHATTVSSTYNDSTYTYFRMIGIQNIAGTNGVNNTYMGTGEWSITFARNTIAYSYDGIKWTGVGGNIFTNFGLEVAWNGSMWVAVGGGTNSIAYSYDGINWTGLGRGILSSYGHAIAWNGVMWVATGLGSDTLAYSYNGINWTGLGVTIFSGGAFGVAWNGTMWIAMGSGANTIAYSYNGVNWIGLGNILFAPGIAVAWNGTMWVALGAGTNTIAYSYDGINWAGEGTQSTVATRYLRFEYGDALTSRYLQIGEVRVYTAAGTNIITPSTTVTASFVNVNHPASNVVDGNNLTFYHSDLATSPWLEIDLGSEQAIYKVEFVNRYDCCYGRIAGARMVLKNGAGTVVYTSNLMTLKDNVTTAYQDFPGNEGYFYYTWFPGTSAISYGSDSIPFMFETSVFSTGRRLSWNGNMWLAAGSGVNNLAYSYNGINWTGLGNLFGTGSTGMGTYFNSARPHRITFPAPMTVATGSGTNTLAYSPDGINWTGVGLGIFSANGAGVATNGSMWVATGSGTNTLAYSTTDIETPYIHLPFENGLYADVMGNSTITATGSPAFVTGTIGSTAVNLINTAGSLIATQYLDGNCTLGNNFSVSLWFKFNTLPATDVSWSSIITLGSPTTMSFQIIYLTLAGHTGFYVQYMQTGNIAASIVGRISITPGTWYHCTAIFQSAGMCSVYLNNTFVGSNPGGGLHTPITNLRIGYNLASSTSAFDGSVDDVRIYNYAITVNPSITWRGLGTSVFSTEGKGVAWNGNMWVAVGSGTNSIAYSYDGVTWIGLGLLVLTQGNAVAWSGSMWVAVGSGTNSIAYSYNGISWVGLGNILFSGNGIAWNGSLWVAVGSGSNTIVYSYNGTTWIGLGATAPLFTSSGNGVAWNGNRWVAVGSGGNTILYSDNGLTWLAAASSCFTTAGNGVTWNGTRWVATGSGTNGIGYSSDGSTWTGGIVQNRTNTLTPQLTGLGAANWIQNGIAWRASASTEYVGTNYAYHAFTNNSSSVNTWGSALIYNTTSGAYTGSISTTIQSIGATSGEWIQLQSTTPLILQSYSYACWGIATLPKEYYIVGSNDGSTWYPLQYVLMSINPCNATFTACSTYIQMNYTGVQTIIGNLTGSGMTTAYSYTTGTYTHFRMIVRSLWPSSTGVAELNELYFRFGSPFVFNTFDPSRYYYHYTLYAGATVTPSSYKPYTPSITLASASSQYLQTAHFTPTTTGLSFAFWYKSNASGSWARIFDFGNAPASNNIHCSINGGNANYLYFEDFNGSVPTNVTISDANYNDNTWRHVVWTLSYAVVGSNTSTWNIYVNGTLKTTASTKSYPNPGVTRTLSYIGRSNWVADAYYNGNIDDFRIYNTVLTAPQVTTIYSGSLYDSTYNTTFSTAGSGIASNNSLSGTVAIQHPVVAVGQGTHSLAYSPDGVQWTGLGTALFNTGYCVAWNGSKWIVGGLAGANTLAYSYDGIQWTGLGTTIFSIQANGIAWNGSLWIAVGSGLNTIAYSTDGLSWTGINNTNFTSCNAVAWNGKQWVAVGTPRDGTNAIAYSADGITWTAISSTIFSDKGNGIAWTGSLWVAVGTGTNSIAYSSDGITWTPSPTGNSIFTDSANSVAWNGTRWVAVGTGASHTLAYSANGIVWTGFGKTLFPTAGNGVCWTGKRFVAIGNGSMIGYSQDGLTWYTAPSGIFSTQGNGVAGNPRLGATVSDSQVALSDSLDVVSDTYHNTGYTNFSATIQSQTYVIDKSNIAIVIKTLPDVPTNVSGALYPSGAAIGTRVSFTYPANTGGGVDAYYASAIDVAGVQPTVTASSPSQPIIILGLVPGTTYRFEVYSSNSAGQSAATAGASSLFFQVAPSVPQTYSVVLNPPTNPTEIVVSFTAPATSGGIANYTVTPSIGSAQTGTALSYTFTGLSAGTFYTFSAYGTNTGGAGAVASRSLTYYTKPDPPTASSITLEPPSAPTGVHVAFTAPTNTGGGALTYVATAYSGATAIASSASGASSPLYITGLTPGMSYTYRIVASNTAVPAIVSDASTAFGPTLYQLAQPDAPNISSITLDPPSDPTGINVAFTTNGNNGGGTLSYVATAYFNGVATLYTAAGSSSPLKVTGLSAGTSYTFKVVASNVSASNTSTASSALIYYTKPTAPTSVSAALHSTTTPTGVNVAFTASSNNGGGTLSYTATAYSGATPISSSTGAASLLKIIGLTAGMSYTYRIVAFNAAVPAIVSDASDPPVTLLYQTNPSVPQSVNASVTPNTTTISWSAPSLDGGRPITSYRVVSSPDRYNSDVLSSSTRSVVATGLENGKTYSFTVTVTNEGGLTSSSTTSDVIPYTKPTAPQSVNVSVTPNTTTISWSAPSFDGGRSITSYQVVSSPARYTSSVLSSSTSSVVATGLVNGTSYTFTVTATNSGGLSNSASATGTPYGVPAATNVSSTSQGFKSVTLNWTEPANNGNAITSYDVSSNNGASWINAGDVLLYTFGDLPGDTNYTLSVRARNAAGPGLVGESKSEKLPAAPTDSPGTPNVVYNGAVYYSEYSWQYGYYIDGYGPTSTISWNSVTNATGYLLYWVGDSKNGVLDVGNNLSIYISWPNLSSTLFVGSSWTTAYVRVVAYNNGGYSPSSAEVAGF